MECEITSLALTISILFVGCAVFIFLAIIAGRFAFIVSDHMADWFDDVCDIFGNWLEKKARKK